MDDTIEVSIVQSALSSQMAKFLVVGGLAYVVNQVALFVLYEFVLAGLAPVETPFGNLDARLLASSVIAVEIAIIARFVMNDQWTFRERRESPLLRRFVHSNIVSWGSPLIALATVNILTPLFDMNYLVANSIGILLGLTWNWIGSTRIVWRSQVVRVDD